MKKQYLKPEVKKITLLSRQHLLAGSATDVFGDAPSGVKGLSPRRGGGDDFDDDFDF